MSNLNKDQPSIRVFAPPGGRSTNIFGVPEPEQPTSVKKNHMQSDIFGCKKDPNETIATKPTRAMTNNIYGNEPAQTVQKSHTYSEKNRSTIFDEAPRQQPSNKPDRQRSDIFGANEPAQSASPRPVNERFKSNIFGNGDQEEPNKRQPGHRQGLRVGYNPINGESYATKDGLNSKVEVSETTDSDKPVEEQNGVHPAENGHAQETPAGNGNGEVHATNGKASHTNVRVVQPPGGRSNGPLW